METFDRSEIKVIKRNEKYKSINFFTTFFWTINPEDSIYLVLATSYKHPYLFLSSISERKNHFWKSYQNNMHVLKIQIKKIFFFQFCLIVSFNPSCGYLQFNYNANIQTLLKQTIFFFHFSFVALFNSSRGQLHLICSSFCDTQGYHLSLFIWCSNFYTMPLNLVQFICPSYLFILVSRYLFIISFLSFPASWSDMSDHACKICL